MKKPVTIAELHKTPEGCLFARRKHCRVSINKEVIVLYNEKPYILITATLSEGGVYVKKNDSFPLGAEVEVTLPFLDKGSFRLQGTIVYTKNLWKMILMFCQAWAFNSEDAPMMRQRY